MNVSVGNLQPRYREPDLLRFEASLDGLANGLRDRHKVCGQPGTEVDPVVGLFFGDDERVARGEGGDVQEGHARTVAPDEAGRHLPLDDTCEHRPHAPLLLPLSGDGNTPSVWGASTSPRQQRVRSRRGLSAQPGAHYSSAAPDSSSDSLARNSILQGFFSV